MSQQPEMHYGEYRERDQEPPYTGAYNDADNYRAQASGQKLSSLPKSSPFTTDQRLALAIVSLGLWVIVFLIFAISMAHTATTPEIASVLQPVLIIGLFIFSTLVLVINILFHSKS